MKDSKLKLFPVLSREAACLILSVFHVVITQTYNFKGSCVIPACKRVLELMRVIFRNPSTVYIKLVILRSQQGHVGELKLQNYLH